MMEVARFAVTIELMPLVQGQIRVISMTLDDPIVRVAVDDAGQIDWTLRGEASRDLNPDNVALSGVEVRNGRLLYTDARSNTAVELSEITANIEARSLAGPWRIDGGYTVNGAPSLFQVNTGVLTPEGAIRVKTDITPGQWPVAIAADGLVRLAETGPSYEGTYNLAQIVPAVDADGAGRGDATGWRSEGSFALTREKLVIDKALLSEGPPDRPSSLAGSMTLTLGEAARFFATIQARQLDLDRSLGEGPKKPIEMATAADEFVKWLRGIPVPNIAGTVRFNVPAIVVGGAVIQDVSFSASPADHGWQVEGLRARLPGQATISADGQLSTGEAVGFGGKVELVVNQPATFAAWWRGKSDAGTGRLLAPFDLSGNATVTLDTVKVEDMTTRIGNATITGSFAWTKGDAAGARMLSTNLEADRLDFTQVRALAELLGGRNLGNAGSLADSYAIKLAAGELRVEDLLMRDVTVDAGFAGGDLSVSSIKVGDIGGAQFTVTRGQIDDILGEPLGSLQAQLSAQQLTELARIVDRLAPDTAFAVWLRKAAPLLGASSMSVTVNSAMQDGAPNTRIDLSGKANATNFDARINLAGVPAAWRQAEVTVAADVKSYDAAGLASQILLRRTGTALEGGASFRFEAAGVPETGLAAKFTGTIAGLALRAEGDIVVPADAAPRYAGTFGIDMPDVAPLLALFDMVLPAIGPGMPISVAGRATTDGLAADLEWQNGTIAGRQVGGRLRVEPGRDGGVHLASGDIQIDRADLGWLAALGLGATPLPTGDAEEPWPRAPFGEPALDGITADIDIAAERLFVGEGLQILNSQLHLAASRDRLDLDVKSGNALGGEVAGGFSVRNVGGNASLTGNFSLLDGALDTIVWQRAGRSVGTGTLDVSANFEATGRSPAGMIASLTGGGTLAINDGEARYLNPKAGVLVIRDSDLGQEFTEDALRDLLGSYIDNGSLRFTQVEAPFAIAAGTVRFQNIVLDALETKATGSAAIDLNTMAIDSDWTLTLDAGDDRFGGDLPPQVGIVFRGPVATPERILDVLQFNSYLNIRQEARLQEILALEEQTRLENAFFNRVKRKITEDAARAARLAEEARLARVAQVTNLAALHAARESAAEQKAEDELIAWWQVAARDAADKEAAEAEAEAAAEEARAARGVADEAGARVAELTSAAGTAGDAVDAATRAADAAAAALAAAEARLADAIVARDEAAGSAATADMAATDAAAALADATAKRDAAEAEAEALGATNATAADRATGTADAAATAKAVADEDAREADARAAILAGLARELAAATEAFDAASTEATVRDQLADAFERAVADAEAKITAARPAADAATRAADDADAARTIADNALALAETALESARASHQSARDAVAEARRAASDAAASAQKAETEAAVTRGKVNAATAETTAIDDATAPEDPALAELRRAADEAERAAAEARETLQRANDAVAEADKTLRERARTLTQAQDAATDARVSLADARAAADRERVAVDEAAQALRAIELELTTATNAAGPARIAADEAAAVVVERTAARDELAARVDAARNDAESAAATAAASAEAAAAAAAEAETARTDATGAAGVHAAARADLAAATAALDTATAALDAARTDAETAADALATAEAAVADATALRDAAGDAVDAAKLAVDDALRAAEVALADLREAEAAAETARNAADTAEAAARSAAARAAVLPAGWRPPERRAEAAPSPANVAVIDLQPVPDILEEGPAITLVPAMPRLKPRRTSPPPAPADIDLSLPTADRPLAITQP
jgi:hypothetical protein